MSEEHQQYSSARISFNAPAHLDHIRKRGEEAGLSNLRSSVADGTSLSGFTDDSVDALTCTWGLESMPDQKMAIGVSHENISIKHCVA